MQFRSRWTSLTFSIPAALSASGHHHPARPVQLAPLRKASTAFVNASTWPQIFHVLAADPIPSPIHLLQSTVRLVGQCTTPRASGSMLLAKRTPLSPPETTRRITNTRHSRGLRGSGIREAPPQGGEHTLTPASSDLDRPHSQHCAPLATLPMRCTPDGVGRPRIRAGHRRAGH
jgi:hypothetical protein